MISLLLSLILITIPFLLVFCFKNKINAFVSILGASIIWHLMVGFVTQFFHIFKYPVLISVHSVVALIILIIFFRQFRNISFKFKINWLAILGFVIILFELWSVHFFYSGVVNTISGPQMVVRNYYPYPYFSDEWVGVSLADYAISNNSLVNINPLAVGLPIRNFTNIFICFSSFISEIFLFTGLVPLINYSVLALFFGCLICLLVFLFLKANKVDSFIAILATLFIPYIVNSANLPGIWYLIPFTIGLILFLISFINFSYQKTSWFLLMNFFSVLIYPPLIIFILPVLLFSIFLDKEIKTKTKIKIITIVLLAFLGAVGLIFYSQRNNINLLTHFVFNSVWHLNLDGGIPALYPWLVMPAILIPFYIIGFLKSFTKKYLPLLVAMIIGAVFWIFYSFSQYYFFIDFTKVVSLSSILLVIFSGLGLNYLLSCFLKKYQKKLHSKFISFVKFGILILFLLSSFVYTNRLNWQNLKLKVSGREDVYVTPAPPVNMYLHQDDLKLFKDIKQARFLSIPWKGLIIGVATGNYPLHSKESIVSNNFLNYNEFMAKNCFGKTKLAQKMKIDFVYSYPFSCNNFLEIGRSQEGFVLYKFYEKQQ